MTAESPPAEAPDAVQQSATVTRPDTVYSARTRRAGAALFLLSGVLGALLGVALLGYVVVGGFAGVPPETIVVFALPVLLVAAVQLYGGWVAWQGRRWRVAILAGVIGLLVSPNPLLIPLKVVGLVFLGLSEDQFV